jgi:hypothetical protein
MLEQDERVAVHLAQRRHAQREHRQAVVEVGAEGALARIAPQVAKAFVEGGGVRFEEFGPDCVSALDLINRGQYEQRFADYWMKSLPEVAARLRAGVESYLAGHPAFAGPVSAPPGTAGVRVRSNQPPVATIQTAATVRAPAITARRLLGAMTASAGGTLPSS